MSAHNGQQARELLALGLDEFGHHTEAENVRKGIDLDDYKVDLWAIRAALDAQPAAAQEADSDARSEAFSDFESDYLTDGNGYAPASTYSACAEAFNAAWPDQKAAYDAAKAAFAGIHGHDKTVSERLAEFYRVRVPEDQTDGSTAPVTAASATDEQYADADALIAHLDGLVDDGGQGGEKWDPAQAAIAGIRAWQAGTPAAPGIDHSKLWRLSEAWVSKAENLATAPHVARSLYACAKELRDDLTAMQQADASPKGELENWKRGTKACAEVLGQVTRELAASPKGGSEAREAELKAAQDAGHDGAIRYVLGYLNGTGDCGGTMYEEILNACGRERIIKSAIDDGELEFTGLADYIKVDGTRAEKRRVRAALRAQAQAGDAEVQP